MKRVVNCQLCHAEYKENYGARHHVCDDCRKELAMNQKQKDRAECCFKLMEYEQLTDNQHDLIVKYEKQFEKKGWLSDRQMEVLEDIFKQAAEKA